MNKASKPKHVAIITNSLHRGGTETHLSQVLPGLKAKGWDVSVYLVSGDGELIAQLEQAGITVHQPSIFFLPLTFVQLLFYLAKRKPSIVQFMLPKAYLLGGISCVLLKQKNLIMCRRSLNNYQRKHRLLAKLEHWLHSKMSFITANNKQAYGELATKEHVTTDKLKLIYNGIDLRRFNLLEKFTKQNIRQQFDLPDSDLTLIVIANIIPYKGHATLLEALAKIKHLLPAKWQLLCVGEKYAYLKDLQIYSEDLEISDNVYWLGMQTEVEKLLAISNIAISCSYEEGFSNAVLEAMAAGLPMIVTDVGGNPEAVIAGQTGLVIPAKDPQALADAIIELVNNPDKMSAMGAAGKQGVQQSFSLGACVDSYDELYQTLVNP